MTAKKEVKQKKGIDSFIKGDNEYVDAWCDGYESREKEDDLIICRMEKDYQNLSFASKVLVEALQVKMISNKILGRLYMILMFICGFVSGVLFLYHMVK